MMLCIPVLFLLAAFASVRLFVPAPSRAPGRLYTFVVDPLTMLVVGLVSTLAFLFTRKGRRLTYDQFRSRKLMLDLWLLLFTAVFWSLEVMTYFDVMGHPFDQSKTGNDFMWNGYIEWLAGPIVTAQLPTYHSVPMTVLAASLLLLQLPCLLLGRRLGFMTAFFNDLDNWSRPKPR